MDIIRIQKGFFQLIQQQNSDKNIADLVAQELSIGKSGAYRRIRSETLLSFEELLILSKKFSISLDTLINPMATGFLAPVLSRNLNQVHDYLEEIESDLRQISQCRDSKLYFLSLEFFFYLFEPKLAAFKFYMWNRIVWQGNDKKIEPFDFDLYLKDKKFIHKIQSIEKLYRQIASEEVWKTDMLNTTLQQIRHCVNSGLFKNFEDAIELFTVLKKLLKDLELIAQKGVKQGGETDNGASIQIWYNEIFETNNTILIDTKDRQLIYFLFDAPNFMISHNQNMYQHGMNYFKEICHFSFNIIGTNEQFRHKCFSLLTKKVETYENDILMTQNTSQNLIF